MNGEVVFLDQSGFPGGAELCLADLAEHLSGRGKVILFSDGPFRQMLETRGVPVKVLRASSSLSGVQKQSGVGSWIRAVGKLPEAILELRRECREATLLYCNTPKALILGVAARAGRKQKMIYHLHDLLEATHFRPANIRLLVSAANRTDLVIANSQCVADAFRKAGGRTRVEVIPNGFDPAAFSAASSEEALSLRKQWNAGKKKVVLLPGRISRWKGQETLLRAAMELPDIVVWLAGDAFFTGDDRKYKGELELLAGDAALRGRVVFTGQQSNMAALMKASDVIVHASTAPEPFGRVVVEGMLAGRPVIASNEGGPSEILRHQVTGWLVPPGDAHALAATIREVLENSQVSSEVVEHATKEVKQKFALPEVLRQTEAALDSVFSR